MSRSRCYLEINQKAFENNLVGLQKLLPKQTGIIGVIKADYYGHGARQLAEIMWAHGVRDFSVAALSEAVLLRKQKLSGSMLILGYVEQKDWLKAYQYDCILTLTSFDQLQRMEEFARQLQITMNVEVKLDTGMHRLGFEPSITDEQIRMIYANPYVHVNGTFSHLCCADSFAENDRQFTCHQKQLFDGFLARVRKLGLDCGRTHLCASSGILNYPDFVYDFVRPGFMLLGFDVGQVQQRYERHPVLGWYSVVENIRQIGENEGISYGHIYHSEKPMKIATIAAGYGDGYPRRLSNRGYVIINGKKAPIVGRICMDQMMADVTDIDCHIEDRVTLMGEGISANQLAEMADTIVDEIVCDLNTRVERTLI